MCDWLEKYSPRSLLYFLGSKTASEQLLKWLKEWKTFYESPPSRRVTPPRNKSVIITGPCGCGKTTMARAACADAGIVNVMELSSIDKRSKETIEAISEAFRTRPVLSFIPASSAALAKQRGKPGAIIIDEIDYCEVGGLPAIMSSIKTTRAPIICIASDKYSKSLQPLIKMSLQLRLIKPSANDIASFIRYIAAKEGIADRITVEAARSLATACNCDVRQTIMEFYIASKSPTKTLAITRNEDGLVCDVPMGVFDMLPKLFPPGPRGVSVNLAERLFLSDRSLVPLMVSENYLKASSVVQKGGDLRKLAEAADSISFSNVIEGGMVKHHAWDVTDEFAFFSTSMPCAIVGGPLAARAEFPSFLARASATGKNAKMLSAVSRRIESHTGSRPDAVSTELMWILGTKYVRPLAVSSAGAPQIAHEMSSKFGMDKTDWDFLLGMASMKEIKITPAVKGALTRAFSGSSSTPIRKRQRADTDEDSSGEEENPIETKKKKQRI